MAEGLGSIHEIDLFISRYQQFLSITSRSNPICPIVVFLLAEVLFLRYKRHTRWYSREDLDKATLHLTESILLLPRSWLEYGPKILQALFLLALALFKSSQVSGLPGGGIYAAKYLRNLRDHPHSASSIPRHEIIKLLVHVLALEVKLGASNIAQTLQSIDEMAVLCHELLTSDPSDGIAITLFARPVHTTYNAHVLDQPSDDVIVCLQLAKVYKPELRDVNIALFICLSARYLMTFGNDDYEEAASILDEITTSGSSGDSQDKLVVTLQRLLASLALRRSDMHQTPEHLEEAFYRARASLDASLEEHPTRSLINYVLKLISEDRFHYFGSIEGLGGSSDKSQIVLPALALFREHGNFDWLFDWVDKKMRLLMGLLDGIRNDDTTKIDEAIEKGRAILSPSIPRVPYASLFASLLLEFFGQMLFEAFQRTNNIEYLDESISTLRQVLVRPLDPRRRFTTTSCLSLSFLTRYRSFPGQPKEDLDEAVKLLSQCVNDACASSPERFWIACFWASVARQTRHPSASTGYESAVSLMHDTLIFAPTLQLQHSTLVTSGDSHRVSLEYASYQVDQHQLREAVEVLERGRALLWSEMRHFRASIDQLLQVHPQLAHKFVAINRDLEELTKSIPPSHKLSMDDGAADDSRAVDPFGRLLLKQRWMLKERDNLISQIRTLPGYDSFLTSPSFDTLRSAASSGPVIIINHSTWRSDILIILHSTPPSLVSTPHDFFDRAIALKDKLLYSRTKYGLDSINYDETLASVLVDLYNLVGKPVIDRLCQLQVPEQSRVWWCPTSVFFSLPLHAMGPIPSDNGEVRYFLDLYICSYTPTLSALIQSRNCDSGSRSLDRPSLLLVAQPDPSLPTVEGEIQVVQALDTEVTSLISEAATPAAVIDGFHRHPFVHFACHGTLEAGFELYGERLTLLEIVRSRLPTAEFAFLSACHTAEVTDGSIVDEGLHLAAAVQYCGFRSVVGTTWAMVDEDGRDLAKHFYKVLLSNPRQEQRIPYHERSAEALQFAVKKLRRKRRISLERWVNFVHYGA
ncbi:CHAT domain-containing protein [Lactarius hatsudake]|nr:CHAT domain-containing protein [Lactarius hatsudake]